MDVMFDLVEGWGTEKYHLKLIKRLKTITQGHKNQL